LASVPILITVKFAVGKHILAKLPSIEQLITCQIFQKCDGCLEKKNEAEKFCRQGTPAA
jgi:hypothetical protein